MPRLFNRGGDCSEYSSKAMGAVSAKVKSSAVVIKSAGCFAKVGRCPVSGWPSAPRRPAPGNTPSLLSTRKPSCSARARRTTAETRGALQKKAKIRWLALATFQTELLDVPSGPQVLRFLTPRRCVAIVIVVGKQLWLLCLTPLPQF